MNTFNVHSYFYGRYGQADHQGGGKVGEKCINGDKYSLKNLHA